MCRCRLEKSSQAQVSFLLPYLTCVTLHTDGTRLSRLTRHDREHLRRNHREIGYKCSRCQVRLSSVKSLNDHYNSEIQCQRQSAIVDDNMDSAQWSSCQGHTRGENGADKWHEIYKIIFGPISPEAMPSPCTCPSHCPAGAAVKPSRIKS